MDDEKILQDAQAALREGRAGEARRLLHGLVERDPHNGRAWIVLSQATEIADQRDLYQRKALEAGAVSEVTPPATGLVRPEDAAIVRAAEVALDQDRAGEVRRLLLPLVERDPGNGRAWFVLSQASSLDSQRQLYWKRAWDAGYRYADPPLPMRPGQPNAPRPRRPDQPPPLFAHSEPPCLPAPPRPMSDERLDDEALTEIIFALVVLVIFIILSALTGGAIEIEIGALPGVFAWALRPGAISLLTSYEPGS
jgi:hypothetical protein